MEKILVIVAHPDDEVLGLGGTIRRLADAGKEIHVVILAEGITSRSETRREADMNEIKELRKDAHMAAKVVGYKSVEFHDFPDNRMDGVDLLDITKIVSKYIKKYRPDTVFTHHHGDLNIDHRRTCEAVLTACRPTGDYCVSRIYAFETPSSTEWNYIYSEPFIPNVYFDVSTTFEDKIKGMSYYRSESMLYPHPRSEEALRALGKLRGSNIGVELAEAFMLLRECINNNAKL